LRERAGTNSQRRCFSGKERKVEREREGGEEEEEKELVSNRII